jgi:hypothetical protein
MASKTTNKKQQQKVGIPAKRRGQQMGFAGNPDQNRQVEADTPAVRGRRKNANKMFGDVSAQEVGTSPAAPRTNSPSTTVTPNNIRLGDTTGETVFKKSLKRGTKRW